MWWRDEDTSPAVSRLASWLAQWESPREEDDSDDDWGVSPSGDSRAFLLVGGEGKSSLAAAAAITAGFRVLEVNNADASFGGVAAQLREATQSRGVPTKTPAGHGTSLLLIDDIDANAPVAQPTLPLAPLFARTANDFLPGEEAIPAGFVRSVRQLAQRSKCPLLLTASRANVGFPALSHPERYRRHREEFRGSDRLASPRDRAASGGNAGGAKSRDPRGTNSSTSPCKIATISDAPLLPSNFPAGNRWAPAREAVPREGYRRYETLLCWPLLPRGNRWRTEIEPISLLEDENTDYFVDGNFLRFFSQIHPERCFHGFPDSSRTVERVRPSILDSRGGRVKLAGRGLSGVSSVWLVGDAVGARALRVEREKEGVLEVRIPAVEPGLYHVVVEGVSWGWGDIGARGDGGVG